MIDLHSHLLPGIDDGAPDEATALAMARIAVADGIVVSACTPHVYPGVYENDSAGIAAGIARFQARLDAEGIGLKLTIGADAHLTPELLGRLKDGTVPTLAGGRYFLLEPPHHVAPPRFEDAVFAFIAAGYLPVITHPERLSWIGRHYAGFANIVRAGAWLQVTAGSLNGRFGTAAQLFAEKLLGDGLVHVLATDAHSIRHRPPLLTEGWKAAEKRVGAEEAYRLVVECPQAILDNRPPQQVAPIPLFRAGGVNAQRRGFLARLAGRSQRR